MEGNESVKVGCNRLAMFLLGATLALGFAFSAYLLASGLVKMKQDSMIRVKGLSSKRVKSDQASWSCTIRRQAPTVQAGYLALEESRTATTGFMQAAGFGENEMWINAIDCSPQFKLDDKGNKTNTIESYVLTQSISAASADVNKIDRISKAISTLLKSGIELHSDAPRFTYSGLEAIKLDLLGAATKNAYERAKTLASNSGGNVGKLNAASQGVFQITPPSSTETSEEGCNDTGSIEKDVRCVVTLEFLVEK